MTTEILGDFGDDVLFGTDGNDIIYGDPEGGTGGGDCAADNFKSNGHAISNIVLYVEVDGEVVKVKLDNFADNFAFDTDDLALDEFIADQFGDG
ncbi:MAG: hypothetical protein HOK83_09090, partial [Rhodospirillaceae bacterium]|nr:hypothetical protein [Rhodospirillaceae bacterium]